MRYPSSTPYICRITSENLWQVRIPARAGGPATQAFSDSVYGTRAAAFAAAVKWRDLVLSNAGEALIDRSHQSHHSSKGNPAVGVSRIVKAQPGRSDYIAWQAVWRHAGRTLQRRFSVRLHGEDKALEMALEARRKGVEEEARRATAEMRRQEAQISEAERAGVRS